MTEAPYNVLSQRQMMKLEYLFIALAAFRRPAGKLSLEGDRSWRWSRAQAIKRCRASIRKIAGRSSHDMFQMWSVALAFREKDHG